jgi:2,3-bisphosphoglycerate-dependent phosphoglycerate mutase
MKKFLLLFVFILSLLNACNLEETTTYYLIRHAEKDRTETTNRNPNLNKTGKERATRWANYFENIDLDAIYSTKYQRTMQTAKPIADNKSLKIQNYDPENMYDATFQKETRGKKVLIVGHSNTTPLFVNKILGEKKYKSMNDKDNSSMYIIRVNKARKTSKIEKLE